MRHFAHDNLLHMIAINVSSLLVLHVIGFVSIFSFILVLQSILAIATKHIGKE